MSHLFEFLVVILFCLLSPTNAVPLTHSWVGAIFIPTRSGAREATKHLIMRIKANYLCGLFVRCSNLQC